MTLSGLVQDSEVKHFAQNTTNVSCVSSGVAPPPSGRLLQAGISSGRAVLLVPVRSEHEACNTVNAKVWHRVFYVLYKGSFD